MRLSPDTIHAIIRRWWDDGRIADWADEYGEPGYGAVVNPAIVIADLWKLTERYPRIVQAMEDSGVDFAFYDEWTVIDGKAFRTQPDSYGWQPSYYYWEGELIPFTGDDDIANLEGIIEDCYNSPDRALNLARLQPRHLESLGWARWAGGYEHGWHPGQNDNPRDIVASFRLDHQDDDYVFVVDGTGQFDIRFSLWHKAV